MKFNQIKKTEATPQQMHQFASLVLGLKIDDLMPYSEIENLVNKAHDGENILVPVVEEVDQTGSPPPPPSGEEGPASASVGGLGKKDPRVLITLHAEERDGVVNNRHKEVGVNGVVWLIKRGEPVEIPYRVYLALENAVRDNVTHDKDGNETHQSVHSVPFSVQRMPQADEIEEFHRRTRDVFCPA